MFFLRNYLLKQNFHPGAVNLFIHHGLRNLAFNLLGIFGPIYLYTIYGSVRLVLLVYFMWYFIYAAFLPLTMQLINKLGFKRAMYVSQPLAVIYFIVFYLVGVTPYVLFFSFLLVVFWWLKTALYWIPYHTDFATITSQKSRAKNFALLTAVVTTTSIVTPTISSLIITYLGYGWLFFLMVLILGVSTFYLKNTPDINERFSYSFLQTYREFLSKKNRRMVAAFFADGVQTVFGIVVWPLFIFMLLKNNFISVGLITSAIVLIVALVRLVIGDFADKVSKAKIVRYSAFFHTLGWLLKIFVHTPVQIFLVGSYHDLTMSAKDVSLHSLMYEKAANHGHYVDEYTVIRDMALCFGRAFGVLAVLLLLPFVGLNLSFALAALATPFIVLLK